MRSAFGRRAFLARGLWLTAGVGAGFALPGPVRAIRAESAPVPLATSSLPTARATTGDEVAPTPYARIKVVGVGGGGCRAIERMMSEGVPGAEFVAFDTDIAATQLWRPTGETFVHVRGQTGKGMGCGGLPDRAARAAEASEPELRAALSGADLVYIAAGLGGGTGTGAAPVIARIARDLGALTVAAVTRPFAFEGQRRRRVADEGLVAVQDTADAVIVLPCDGLLPGFTRSTTLLDAYRAVDGVLDHGIRTVAGVLDTPGLLGVDFADVASVFRGAGRSGMGTGRAEGESAARHAAHGAVSSALLSAPLGEAAGALVHVVGGDDLTLGDAMEVGDIVYGAVGVRANYVFQATVDPGVHGEVTVTVIGTGLGLATLGGGLWAAG